MSVYEEEYENMSLCDLADEFVEPLFTIKKDLPKIMYINYAKQRDENEKLKEQLEELKHIMYVIRDDNGLNHLWCKDMILDWLENDE